MVEWLVKHRDEINQVSLIGAIAVGMVLEMMAPLRPVSQVPLWRWCNNLLLTALNYALLLSLGPLLFRAVTDAAGPQPLGWLPQSGAGWWSSLLVTFLVLELVSYWFHRASHSFSWLWRLHAVHHSDTEQDVTTTGRHHPLELLLSAVINLPVLMLLGPDISVLVTYTVLHALIGTLSHANLSLGATPNRMLDWFLVTPDFHRVHHSADKQFTDSNFGTLCSLYDFVFGTARRWTRQQQINQPIGLEYCRKPKDSRLDQLLIMPVRAVFPS